MEKEICLTALFTRATTTVDGGWRITFDLGQNETNNIAHLSELKDQVLSVVVMTEDYVKTAKIKAKK